MIEYPFGTASGPYGDVRIGVLDPFPTSASYITLVSTIPDGQGLTPMHARTLAALLVTAADECERMRKGPAR